MDLISLSKSTPVVETISFTLSFTEFSFTMILSNLILVGTGFLNQSESQVWELYHSLILMILSVGLLYALILWKPSIS